MPIFQDYYYNHAKDILKRHNTLYSRTYERIQTGNSEHTYGCYENNDPTEISFNFSDGISRFDLPTARGSKIFVWMKACFIENSPCAILLINIESHNKTVSRHHRFKREGAGYIIEAEDTPEIVAGLEEYLTRRGFELSLPFQFQRKRLIQFAPEAPEPKQLSAPVPTPPAP